MNIHTVITPWDKDHLVRDHEQFKYLYNWLCQQFKIVITYDTDYNSYPFRYSIDGHDRQYQCSRECDAVIAALNEIFGADGK